MKNWRQLQSTQVSDYQQKASSGAMADMGLLIHLLCLLWSAPAILCGTLRLTSSGQYAVLGREFSFTCAVVDANVSGLISFMRGDGQSFPTVCRVYVETGNRVSGEKEFLCSAVDGQANTYSLTIRNVSRDDSTVWRCQGGGMRSNNVTLDVKYPPTVAIQAVTPCSGFTFRVNEINVALNCSVKGANPAPTTFTWYHGGTSLQNGPSPIYTLGRVTRSSRGRYRCTADNGISPPGQAKVKVDVHYPPTVRVKDTKRVFRESGDLTMQCTAEAKPNVTSVVWTKEGVGARVSDNGILHLRNTQKTDAGVYVCTATNIVTSCSGRRQTESSSGAVTVVVQYPPTVAIHAVTPCSGFTFLVNEINVALNCSVKGANPAPTTFTWYHGDAIMQNGPSPIYTLGHVTRSSRGRYRCTADNGISPPGQDDVTVDVHYPPTVHVDDTKRVVRESEDLTVQCTAEANPEVTSVVWTKGGVGVRISDSRTLHLRNIQKADAGVYVCTTTNIVTSCSGRRQIRSSSGTVTLEVQSRPHLPSNLKVVNIRPRSVTLRWEKGSNGGAKQRFNIQYRQPGGQWTTHPTSPTEEDALQLDIEDLQPGTVYEIWINAQNEYGTSNYTSAIVTTDTANSSGVPVYVVVIACVASVLLTAALYKAVVVGSNSSGVPVYVVVIACVASVLLTAALYKAVVVGWAKRKSSSQPATTTEVVGNYETTTRDMNVGENAYCSLAPVEAVYVNTNNQPRPTSSSSAASRQSQSQNTYYSIVTDSAD